MTGKKSSIEDSIARLERASSDGAGKSLLAYRHNPSELNQNYTYSNEILTSAWLPRRLGRKDQEVFTRKFSGLTFITTTGRNEDLSPIGLPSGSIARKLFISLIDKSFRTQSPIVEFQSCYALLRDVGLTIQTNNRRTVHDQFKRLSTCRIEIYYRPPDHPGRALRWQGSMFDFAEMYEVDDGIQTTLIPSKVIFAESFFRHVVQRSGFGYLSSLIRKTKSPLEIDILLWLVRRVAFTGSGISIPVHQLKAQFGSSSMANYDFTRWFEPTFKTVADMLGIEEFEWVDDTLWLPSLRSEQKRTHFRYNPLVAIAD